VVAPAVGEIVVEAAFAVSEVIRTSTECPLIVRVTSNVPQRDETEDDVADAEL
jgi:succinyl-CoA synthetase alpha subunit